MCREERIPAVTIESEARQRACIAILTLVLSFSRGIHRGTIGENGKVRGSAVKGRERKEERESGIFALPSGDFKSASNQSVNLNSPHSGCLINLVLSVSFAPLIVTEMLSKIHLPSAFFIQQTISMA